MNPNDLISLLGRHNTDPLVEAALRHYAVRNRPEVEIDDEDANGPVVETQSWVKNSRAGIEFGFQDEAAWLGLDETQLGKRPMVLIQIYLYGRHEGVRPYQGQLPFGLELSDDKATVRQKLVQFESTRHSYICDTWDTPEFRLTVGYADDETCIEAVICILREPPLPALGYALQPVPTLQTIVGLFGRALNDPAVQSAFDPLGLQAQIDQIKDTGEAYFQHPFGVSLEFALPEDKTKLRADDILLSGVTFFDDREQGARRWPGELPHEIRFGDSMETVVQKLGRPPDTEHYDLISGRALWVEPTLTVNVFYDTTENRTLRVTALAPMIIRTHRARRSA
jgi:hypothetical protein